MALVKDNVLEYLFGRGQCEVMGGHMMLAFSALFLWLLREICKTCCFLVCGCVTDW